jgi:hypothetical protein
MAAIFYTDHELLRNRNKWLVVDNGYNTATSLQPHDDFATGQLHHTQLNAFRWDLGTSHHARAQPRPGGSPAGHSSRTGAAGLLATERYSGAVAQRDLREAGLQRDTAATGQQSGTQPGRTSEYATTQAFLRNATAVRLQHLVWRNYPPVAVPAATCWTQASRYKLLYWLVACWLTDWVTVPPSILLYPFLFLIILLLCLIYYVHCESLRMIARSKDTSRLFSLAP